MVFPNFSLLNVYEYSHYARYFCVWKLVQVVAVKRGILWKSQPKKIPSQISFFGERPLLEGVAVNEEFLRLRWRFAQDDRGSLLVKGGVSSFRLIHNPHSRRQRWNTSDSGTGVAMSFAKLGCQYAGYP